MNLDAIPDDTQVLIDANILIYAVQHVSIQCRRLITRCASREVIGFITAVGVAEFCHRRMMQEAQSLGLAVSNPAKALGQDAALVRNLSRYRQEMDDLLASGMSVLYVEKSDFARALELQQKKWSSNQRLASCGGRTARRFKTPGIQ